MLLYNHRKYFFIYIFQKKIFSNKIIFHRSYCLCDNKYGFYNKTDECDCDKNCIGNKNQICGSTNKNSIYEILCKFY